MSGTVDFHTHFIPRSLSNQQTEGCIRLEIESSLCGRLYAGERLYRKIDDRCWDVAHRLSDMDDRGVALQVLSPIPVTNNYIADARNGLLFAQRHNAAIAAIVRKRPDRFAGLGAVPLQDVDAACTELRAIVCDMGLLGVEIGTTVGVKELDDQVFMPFWDECDKLGAVVFVHPETAPGFERHGKYGLVASAGYPSETGITAAKLLMSGIVERYSNSKIVLAHGGGTLPWLLPRLDRFWEMMPSARSNLSTAPSLAARAFYCDSLTFDAANLQLLANRIGFDHVLVGSDYPFNVMEDPPGAVLADLELHSSTEYAVRQGNFRTLQRRVNASLMPP